ncbi:MAG: permease [Proteobacteria bacterium]|nr:MAG: permease [Pseudomonadota bacterium]
MVALWLAMIVFAAFGIEAALGFGCNVLAVTVAIHLMPLEQLLPVLVSLNLLVSAWIAIRHREHVDRRALLTRILPLMLAGMPLGIFLFAFASGPWLKGGFGLFVLTLATVELSRALRASREARPIPLSSGASAAVLVLGGLMHGLYASGGPMAVYHASRCVAGKRRFRSTLSALWLLLNLLLLASYAWRGALTVQTLRLAGPQLLPLGLGVAGGEALHARIDERAFRLLVFSLLAAGGLVLLLSMI